MTEVSASTERRKINQEVVSEDFHIGRGIEIELADSYDDNAVPGLITTSQASPKWGSAALASLSERESERNKDKDKHEGRPSNEYVLNVAFISFLAFLLVQVVFALIARSQAMLADSMAMAVDAFTYLFNLVAEKLKKRSFNNDDSIPLIVRKRKHKRMGLYLELIPPLISVVTLVVVSVFVLVNAVETILRRLAPGIASESNEGVEEMPNAWIMFLFSSLNLALDVLNVTCFSKAKNFGFLKLPEVVGVAVRHEASTNALTEETSLLSTDDEQCVEEKKEEEHCRSDESYLDDKERTANLNMCSAYTHVIADTLRSVTVVLAASLVTVFDCISADVADATGAIIVSFIIAISLGPLLAGLFDAWSELRALNEEERKEEQLLKTLMRDSVVDLRDLDI